MDLTKKSRVTLSYRWRKFSTSTSSSSLTELLLSPVRAIGRARCRDIPYSDILIFLSPSYRRSYWIRRIRLCSLLRAKDCPRAFRPHRNPRISLPHSRHNRSIRPSLLLRPPSLPRLPPSFLFLIIHFDPRASHRRVLQDCRKKDLRTSCETQLDWTSTGRRTTQDRSTSTKSGQ